MNFRRWTSIHSFPRREWDKMNLSKQSMRHLQKNSSNRMRIMMMRIKALVVLKSIHMHNFVVHSDGILLDCSTAQEKDRSR